jgi:glycosyltransferase involved in cell wall biosynthesis
LKWIEPKKNVILLNQAYCGLALSAIEGGMHASMEYLLCGLPVVTTESLGGRSYFLNSNNSIFVDDNSDAVLSAVNELKKGFNPDRSQEIRDDAITMQKKSY